MRVPIKRPVRTLPLLLAVIVSVGLISAVPVTTAHADERTISVTNFRTGWDPAEPGLSGLAPTDGDFGVQFDTPLQGQIYAQPLVIDRSGSTPATLVIASEADRVYGLSPHSGAVRWSVRLGTPWPSSTIGCGNTTTQIGVTSTPVYDPSTHAVYVMAKTDGTKRSGAADPNHPLWQLHALSVSTGKELNGWPVKIAGHADNSARSTFNPKTNAQRPGLLLMGHTVYAGFASACDIGPFDGFVAGVSTTTHRLTGLWTAAADTNSGEAGIWQSGGGLVSDGAGQIIFATGNGSGNPGAPARGAGKTSHPTNLGESVVRLGVNSRGKMAVKDFFSPTNNASLNADDIEVGSGGPLAIPKKVDGKRLLVQVGKDGRVFLLNRDNLGGMGQGPHGSDAAVDVAGPFNGVWGHPAYWGGPANASSNGGYVYDVENQGPLRAFHISSDAGGSPALTPVATSSGDFGYSSGSPIVTSSGLGAGGAVVWVVYTRTPFGANGELRAYDAMPHDGALHQLYSSKNSFTFDDEKFTTPATDGNRIFFGTADGHVLAFGESSTPAVAASPTYFGVQPAGSSSTSTVTVTALRNTDIENVSTQPPFSVDPMSQHLAKGQSVGIPVTFSPTEGGIADGDLAVTTSGGRIDHLDVFGYGSQPGFTASGSSLDFGQVPIGASKTLAVDIQNTSTDPQTVSATLTQSDGSLPLSIRGSQSATIGPLQTWSVPLIYAPGTNADSSDSATLTVGNGSGSPAMVNISAESVDGEATLTLHPDPLSFGSTTVGTSVSKLFTVRNTGNIPLTISKAASPAGDFHTSTPLPEGTTLQPHQAIRQPITFTPSRRGARSGAYVFNFSDGTGASHSPQVETFHGSGTDPIARYYASLGGRYSVLGRKRGPERSVAGGRFQRYQHGRIYWSSATGAHALLGPVLRHYLSLKGPAGFAGFPISNVHRTIDHRGHVASFAHDTAIYTHKHLGTFAVNGPIRDRWDRLSNVIGRLGYPTSDEYKTHHGLRRSNFQHGHITWNPRTHKTKVKYSRH